MLAPAPRPSRVLPALACWLWAAGAAAQVITDPFAEAEKAPPPRPTRTFEELLKDAVPVADLATLIAPLYARCDDHDDLPRRQCEGMRAFLLDRLHGRTFVAVSDMVPEASPWDPTAREIELEVSGCLACTAPPRAGGEPRYLASRPPSHIEGGHAAGLSLATYQLAMDTKVRADRFLERAVPRLRVQHIFKVGQIFGDTQAAPYKGVLIVPVAHRVYDRCTGQVAASSVPSAPLKVAAARDCPRQGAEELSQAELAQAAQRAALPERLTTRQVDEAFKPVQEKIHECYVEFQEPTGTARVGLVLSREGKLTQITLAPPFDKADMGVCIRSQLKSVAFPRFRGEPMRFDYAFQVN